MFIDTPRYTLVAYTNSSTERTTPTDLLDLVIDLTVLLQRYLTPSIEKMNELEARIYAETPEQADTEVAASLNVAYLETSRRRSAVSKRRLRPSTWRTLWTR